MQESISFKKNKATQFNVLLFLFFYFLQNYTYSQDTTVIATQDTISVIRVARDTNITQIDSLQPKTKQTRAEKTKKVFKFLSYFNYNDRGYGKDFSGVEKYEKFKGKKITCVDIVIFKPFGCTEDSCPTKISKGQKFGNAIHFKGKEWFVKGDIFFKEGDEVNPTLFADSEKLLWQRNKFKDVKILIVEDSLNTDNVEVMVFLQDRLSWSVFLGYAAERIAFTASTFNFFGLPNTLSLFGGVILINTIFGLLAALTSMKIFRLLK